jgi:hypothetical protein
MTSEPFNPSEPSNESKPLQFTIADLAIVVACIAAAIAAIVAAPPEVGLLALLPWIITPIMAGIIVGVFTHNMTEWIGLGYLLGFISAMWYIFCIWEVLWPR